MKRFVIGLLLAIVFLFSVAPAFAQQQSEEQVSVPKSLLTREQLDSIQAQNLKDKIDRYGKWVGAGHEIGVAVNDSLAAITTNANAFAQTPVGKWTVFIVIWKVIGHDLMGFILGIGTLIIGLPLWIWSYRKYLPQTVITERTYDTTNRWFRRVATEKFAVINQVNDRDTASNWYRAMHFVFLVVLFGLSMWVMFS